MTTGKAKPYYATQELHDTVKRIGNGNQSRGLQIAGGYHGRLVEELQKAIELYESEVHDSWDGTSQVDAMLSKAGSGRALLTEIAEAGK